MTEKLLTNAQYDSAVLRAAYREYPRSLRATDAAFYARLEAAGMTREVEPSRFGMGYATAMSTRMAWVPARLRWLIVNLYCWPMYFLVVPCLGFFFALEVCSGGRVGASFFYAIACSKAIAPAMQRIVYLPCTAENGFDPPLPDRPADMVYLCFPNNPTGAVLDRGALKRWVDWARDAGAVLLYDAAYESYIQDPDIPHSIYEVPGARQVAVEFRSYSKTAGFTGTRCAYTVVPRDVTARSSSGEGVALHGLWFRRQSTKFNGAPYVIQRAAAAVYTPEAQKQVRAVIDFYMENARLIREGLEAAGLSVYGGRNAPYIWVKTPAGLDSWGFFDKLLNEAHVVGTPGAGFGRSGEGYFRLTGFGDRASTEEAVARIKSRLKR